MKQNALFLFLVIGLITTSCKKETPERPDSRNGILVVNEGLFQTGTGELSWISASEGIVLQNAFTSANNGLLLGNVANSAAANTNSIFIAVNNAQRIMVADRNTFEFQYLIPDIHQSRFMVLPDDTTLVVSAWGDGFSGSLSKVNLNQRSTEKTIHGLRGPEEAAIWMDQVLVPASGGFGTHNVVYRIHLNDFSIADSIIVGDRPVKVLVIDQIPYILCSGKFSFIDPSLNTSGGLYRLESGQASLLKELPNGVRGLTYLKDSRSVFAFEANTIYRYNLSTGVLSSFDSPAVTTHGLRSVRWGDKEFLAVCDAKDYISAGELFLVDSSGNVFHKWTTGQIPTYVLNL